MKKELRNTLRRIMADLGAAEIHTRSNRAAQLFLELPEYRSAEIMMTYLSLPLEADTTSIVLRAWRDGKRVLAPLVSWESRQMIPIEINSLDEDVALGPQGIRQPIQGEPIPIELIDLVIVPGLGFDVIGNRLGRGRGFYDRFLAQRAFRGVPCGLALESQVVSTIPAGPMDVPMALLVTDEQVRRFREGGAGTPAAGR
ncbi:MAG: 5-formyltetrahydrofolate cyclo-ligase [Phycisphaerae bacterium]|nr:5-formyltetrahydrofolate cyclo-ligase [Phycisphaerae bacterium]NUQ45054.1 5-formyltetrahydrofolate cyclo-ligase [Phycisphaerae bacterium]